MGRPKETLELPGGRTMIQAVLEAMAALGARVVVVGRNAPVPGVEGLAHVADRRPGQGPLGGIEALLASGLDAQYLVCPCDLPLVTPALLARLVGAAGPDPASAFHVRGEAEPRPLPIRIGAEALPAVRRLLDQGTRAVHALLREIGAEAVPLTATEAALLAPVNTPADYRAIVARLTGAIPDALHPAG